jgi:hypothetical protein
MSKGIDLIVERAKTTRHAQEDLKPSWMWNEATSDANIAWYAAATRIFPAGTAEGETIRRSIPTRNSPAVPAETTPAVPQPQSQAVAVN